MCVKKCPQSQIRWIDVSLSSPQSLQDSSLGGGLLWSRKADCLRSNTNHVRNLAICPTADRTCLNNCSLFGRSGVGYQTLVCLLSTDDCHISVHLEIMFSLSFFLIALFAVSPEPSTAVELHPAFASWLANMGLDPFQDNCFLSSQFV
jgi:hypothetical protein